VALALALPSPRPGLPAHLDRALTDAVFERYPNVLTAAASFPHGHAAGLLALAAACRKLAAGTLDACVVAAVDSYLSAETLEWLESRDQLHGAGLRQNPWGFIPGEAAGALLVTTAEFGQKLGIDPLAHVLGIGTAVEPHRMRTETVCVGDGLTQALRLALGALPPGTMIDDIYSDMNGEPYRADEYGFSAVRVMQAFSATARMWTPADCWGDVGAVSGPLSMMLAACDAAPTVPQPLTLVWSSSEDGHRGAAVVRTAPVPRQ
jgi:3-oxoacyl-[acyl-carrier-protein] synthase I